ncbi:hypothetical protein ACFLZ7_01985 [Nanoarchaeota archaeon]
MPAKIIITDHEPGMNPTSDELSRVILARIGLMPRKQGSTDKMHNVLLELYEKAKLSQREKRPESAVMTVEEMGVFAGITRQTMYDYLKRWLDLNMIVKTSYINEGKVIIGYKLNGNTLESAFEKATQKINNHMETSMKLVSELQKLVKNEKIAKTQKGRIEEQSENSTVISEE